MLFLCFYAFFASFLPFFTLFSLFFHFTLLPHKTKLDKARFLIEMSGEKVCPAQQIPI
jgi:hypothetical protein